MQRGIQAVPLDREGAVFRNKLLPRQRAHAFKQRVKRLRRERAQADQHPFGAPQVKVRPGKRIFIPLKQHTSVFRAYFGQPAAKPQLICNNAFQPEQRRAAHSKFHLRIPLPEKRLLPPPGRSHHVVNLSYRFRSGLSREVLHTDMRHLRTFHSVGQIPHQPDAHQAQHQHIQHTCAQHSKCKRGSIR